MSSQNIHQWYGSGRNQRNIAPRWFRKHELTNKCTTERNRTAGWTQKYVYPDWQLVVRIVVTNYCYSYVTKRICLKCIMSPASSYCLNSDRFPIIIMSYFTHQIIGSKWVLMKVSQHTRKYKVCTWTKYAYITHSMIWFRKKTKKYYRSFISETDWKQELTKI